jgi:hypothetical protein
MRIGDVLEKALTDNRISRQEWESILDLAVMENETILNGENDSLVRLVALLEGGVVEVEGVTQAEVLQRLAVFA